MKSFNIGVIVGLYVLAILADFICFFAPNQSTKPRIAYQPPSQVKLALDKGFYFHPFKLKINSQTFERKFIPQTEQICDLSFLVQAEEYKLLGFIPFQTRLFGSQNCPHDFHMFGTDKLGRDYFARLVFGLRPSLFAGLLGIIIAFPLGVLYGAIAGYRGGALGETMMRFVELILSLPTLYLLVILVAILPPSLSNVQRLLLITVILSFLGWVGLARVVRGQVLALRKKEFVQAAWLIGLPEWKIIVREIVPQLSSYLVIALTLSFPGYVLAETTLSFLGLGVNQPDASLGNLLAESRNLSNLFLRPWMAIAPTLIIILLTWCCNSLGDHLRDLFDPKQVA